MKVKEFKTLLEKYPENDELFFVVRDDKNIDIEFTGLGMPGRLKSETGKVLNVPCRIFFKYK